MKKMLMAILLISLLLVTTTALADTRTSGLYTYNIRGNGTLTITGFDWQANGRADIYIPSMIDGYTVTTIGKEAFANATTSDSVIVTLPDTITTLEEKAFWGAPVSIINIPTSLQTIMSGALSVKNLEVQYTVAPNHDKYTTIDGVLFDKTKRELVAFSGKGHGSNRQYTYTIPDGIKSIGDYAFYNHDSNKKNVEIYFPDSITAVEKYAFYNWNLDMPREIKTYGGENIVELEEYAFYGVHFNGHWSLSDGIIEIPAYAFANSSLSKTFAISSNVEEIGEYAFANMGGNLLNQGELTWDMEPGKVKEIPDHAFEKNLELKELNIAEGVRSIGEKAFSGCQYLETITLPESMKTIGANAFNGCRSLVKISLPEGITSIGANAFDECYKLTDITLPESITSIGEDAFIRGTVTLTVTAGSYAETYARENGHSYRYEGQETNDLSWLND